MKMKKLRWGVIGCANIAVSKVIPAIQQSEFNEVTAIASRGGDKAKTTANKLGISKSYGSYEELLSDPHIDAVYIPLPNHLHKEWTIKSARAGKHVLCEKPISVNASDARDMVHACEESGVKLAEAFMYRHHPRYEQIKKIISDGEIGNIRGIRGAFTYNGASDYDNVRFKANMGGGSIYDVGAYPINAARFILEREPEAATMHAFFSSEHDNVDMMASGLIEFSDGVALTFDCGMWAGDRNELQILGAEGRIDVPSAFVYGPDEANFKVTVKGTTREESVPRVNQYSVQADDFALSILKEQSLRYAPSDAIRNMRVIDACLQSARKRVRIVIN